MELTRKLILQSIYGLDYSPKITPTRPLFRKFAEDFILKHYGVCESDLASKAAFKANVKNLDIRTGKRMGSNCNFPGFLDAGVHQSWLSEVFPRPKTKEEVGPPTAKSAPSGGRRRGRPTLASYSMYGRSGRFAKVKKAADENELLVLFEALRLKLKRSGFKDAAKAVRFLAIDPKAHGKKVLDALATPSMFNSTLFLSTFEWVCFDFLFIYI